MACKNGNFGKEKRSGGDFMSARRWTYKTNGASLKTERKGKVLLKRETKGLAIRQKDFCKK